MSEHRQEEIEILRLYAQIAMCRLAEAKRADRPRREVARLAARFEFHASALHRAAGRLPTLADLVECRVTL